MAIAWVHPAQATRESATWLERIAEGAELVVPALWPLEVGNALLTLHRRKKINAAERSLALRALAELPVSLDHTSVGFVLGDLSDLAAKEALTVYDASYLELAIRRSLPLACKDGPLRTAASRRGLRVEE